MGKRKSKELIVGLNKNLFKTKSRYNEWSLIVETLDLDLEGLEQCKSGRKKRLGGGGEGGGERTRDRDRTNERFFY